MGQLNILGRVSMYTDIAPWWEDTFYEKSTRSLTEPTAMVQELLQDTCYHLACSQVEVNLVKKTATIPTSVSIASAKYTGWDWVYRVFCLGKPACGNYNFNTVLLLQTLNHLSS
ncbi:unnamed protein product [Oncorhynchus mykiss]|uniref:Uncharacterized protein n=1 Tax=Oncorhynchus mykiss TaxID=8022 RepID=A0A060WNG9_ONCMY|nr:unnamed protein product [Oncorhynchus mykiss]